MLADNTQGVIKIKLTKPGPVASAAPHPITRGVKLDNFQNKKAQNQNVKGLISQSFGTQTHL